MCVMYLIHRLEYHCSNNKSSAQGYSFKVRYRTRITESGHYSESTSLQGSFQGSCPQGAILDIFLRQVLQCISCCPETHYSEIHLPLPTCDEVKEVCHGVGLESPFF